MPRCADRIDRRGEDLKSLHHDTQAAMVWLAMLSGQSLGVVFEVQIVSSCKRLVGRACPLCINRSALGARFADSILPRRLPPRFIPLRGRINRVPFLSIPPDLIDRSRRAAAGKADHADRRKIGWHCPTGGNGQRSGVRRGLTSRARSGRSHWRSRNRELFQGGDERHARSSEDHRRPGAVLAHKARRNHGKQKKQSSQSKRAWPAKRTKAIPQPGLSEFHPGKPDAQQPFLGILIHHAATRT